AGVPLSICIASDLRFRLPHLPHLPHCPTYFLGDPRIPLWGCRCMWLCNRIRHFYTYRRTRWGRWGRWGKALKLLGFSLPHMPHLCRDCPTCPITTPRVLSVYKNTPDP